MANSVHNDSSDFTDHAAGQTPIVLARLPRVGAAPPMPASPTAAQAVPPPEVMPQLDLRTEIDQRIQLHIANTPVGEQAPMPSHFADHGHVVERRPRVRPPELEPESETTGRAASRRYDSSAKTQARVGEPTTFSEKLFQLHAQLSPHAGLIVALALIASAGLLYWMIVGPTKVPMSPSYENYSENNSLELRDQDAGGTSNYLPTFTAEVPSIAVPVGSSDQWTKVPLPVPPSVELPSPLALPLAEPTKLPKLPSAEESIYLETDRSQALDFTKLGSPTGDVPKPLPAIARRPTTTTQR